MIKRNAICAILAAVLSTGALWSVASAAQLLGLTQAPNWALGSPQPVFIAGCSTENACVGHFGLGPLSDVLDVGLLGRPTTEVSLRENGARQFVGGRLETGVENPNQDWWNLWIPNARWVGLGPNNGIVYYLFDADGPGVSDAIAYVNINGGAHILFASDVSDPPPDTSSLPPDFPISSFFDVFFEITLDSNGLFDNSNVPPPSGPNGPLQDCTGDVGCTPTSDFVEVAFVPEPTTLGIIGIGFLGLGLMRRRRAA